jgi:hypothetical protein
MMETNATAATRLLERIESAGFDRAAFLAAVDAFGVDESAENEGRMAHTHPANWMTPDEIDGEIQDAVLDILFA